MLGAVLFGHQEMKAVIKACNELKELVGNEIGSSKKMRMNPIIIQT